MIKARNLSKSYGNLPVLKGIHLDIKQAEVVAIVGASGAGKTTLLQILGTLEKPDSGELLFGEVNPFKLNDRALSAFRNKHIGFIFQFHQLLPEFTALENVMIPALIHGASKSVASARASSLLDKMNLAGRVGHKPSALSGGEQQRVAVARALMNEPQLLLADEPSGNLDSKHAKELHELFFSLREELNQTIVIVTHNEELSLMADRRLTMMDGQISA
jgi:lipoprotein-releasing system ATP-binding protein